MNRKLREALIALAIGGVSELWPLPGAILAAIVFREGIHSDHPSAYMAVTFALNFIVFAGLTYWILHSALARIGGQPKRMTLPRKG